MLVDDGFRQETRFAFFPSMVGLSNHTKNSLFGDLFVPVLKYSVPACIVRIADTRFKCRLWRTVVAMFIVAKTSNKMLCNKMKYGFFTICEFP